ncbi:MFS transporter [Streptomyces sp. NPDC048291]|uniref:MFS transporter n=1 Tax=Streptomyces sp. NPDC048291 TaxID=3365530 RepID=UPI00371D734A
MSTGQGATASSASAAPVPEGWTPRLAVSLFFMAMVMEIVSLSYAKVATALPGIAAHFHTTQAGWLLTASLLFGAVASPLLGRLADLYGKRRVLLAALGIGWLGSLVAATAPGYGLLIVGRLLQGALIACLFLSYSLIRDVYPPRTVPLAVSICTGGLGLAAVITPFLNGWLLDTWGWRSVFVFDLIWVTVMAVAIPLTTPESPVRATARLDLLGALLLGGGAAAVLVAVSFGPQWGWGSARTLLLGLLGLVMLAGWLVSARRVSRPLVDLAVLARRPIVAAAVVSGLVYGTSVVTASLLPIMSMTPRVAGGDYGLGLSATGFARVASPNAAAIVVGGLLVGLLVRRVGARALLGAGLLVFTVGALLLAFSHGTVGATAFGAAVAGVGTGLGYAATPNLVIENTPAEEQGAVSSVVQICQSGFSAVVPVVLFTILAENVRAVVAGSVVYSEDGLRDGLFLAVGLALFGALLIATVFRRTAAGPAPAVTEKALATGG